MADDPLYPFISRDRLHRLYVHRSVYRSTHADNSEGVKTVIHLTMRWSERRTAVRSSFEITSTLPPLATRALVRRRSSYSR